MQKKNVFPYRVKLTSFNNLDNWNLITEDRKLVLDQTCVCKLSRITKNTKRKNAYNKLRFKTSDNRTLMVETY